jgi:hypothetical protein
MKNFILFTIAIFVFAACTNKNDYELNSDKTYEKSAETLAEREKKSPSAFINVTGSDKKNFFGQTVVRGTIFNNAKVITYKDVSMKLSFYSKTGALLEEDNETIYEAISPGASRSFKSKYFTPKGTDSVGIRVISAKY